MERPGRRPTRKLIRDSQYKTCHGIKPEHVAGKEYALGFWSCSHLTKWPDAGLGLGETGVMDSTGGSA